MSVLECFKEIDRLFDLKRKNEIQRLGKLFSTDLNHYFYDTGTGKVLQLDDDDFKIMQALFELPHINVATELIQVQEVSVKAISNFCQTVVDEHLFRAYKPDRLYSIGHNEILEEQVNNGLRQVILELTGRCNLRCGYCIYNEDCSLNRDFNSSDMSMEIAKATIDYTAKHSGEKIAVTFYGGEPLLRFDLLKWVIEYSLETLKGKELTFSLTTNLTLVTKGIAEYLASVPGLSIVCSLDGPEKIQNAYRKFSNGEGSFSRAIQGLKLLCDAFSLSENTLSINAVFAPPYSHEKLNEINSFFAGLEFLPANTGIDIGYVAEGSLQNARVKIEENRKVSPHLVDPLWTWIEAKAFNRSVRDDANDISLSGIEKALISIEDRFLTDKPSEFYPFNGCCIPGMRRLYVSTTGHLYVCERVGLSPSIGHIMQGIDFNHLKKYYVDDYSNGSIQQCQNCWAIRLCSTCYAHNYTEFGFNSSGKNAKCNFQRRSHLKDLILYHTIREIFPEKLKFLERVKMQ
ncbi:radical SAM protein [Paenibacillus macerans]|uniref:radical SAM protein n=1 Tax=Paenibacillus macerans TaxID=44252 RepID=UPI00203ABB11|nr:radical SAM protein [Paenibacillus macerans]MCM3702178.1 radical SAM protein [Paenibacillus macerans]